VARPWAEMFQVLWTTLLNLAGVDQQPREVRGYRVGSSVQRTIAHLAAQDSSDGRLLLCDSSGRLYVLPVGSSGVAPVYSAAGRLGVNVRDGTTDTQIAAVTSLGRLTVQLYCDNATPTADFADGPAAHALGLNIVNYYMKDAGVALKDVYDAGNHWLKVTDTVSQMSLSSLATILTDCWDQTNHAIRTKEAT
jgi:hypothetical protein